MAYKGRGVVGFDLAGAEYDHPAKHHKAAFQLVRDNNINVTIHAGEAYGPESIAQAIHVCGAHRIGHGCRLRENGDLLHYVNDHRIPLECCPSSNVQTGAIRDLANHPLKLYYDLGLRVTVNTDNRLVTDTTVSRGALALPHADGAHAADLKQIVLAGFKSAFLPFHVKQQYLRTVSDELRAFPDEIPMPSVQPPAMGASPRRRSRGAVVSSRAREGVEAGAQRPGGGPGSFLTIGRGWPLADAAGTASGWRGIALTAGGAGVGAGAGAAAFTATAVGASSAGGGGGFSVSSAQPMPASAKSAAPTAGSQSGVRGSGGGGGWACAGSDMD